MDIPSVQINMIEGSDCHFFYLDIFYEEIILLGDTAESSITI